MSLYFGLEEGAGPDMGVIGQCLIQLSSAIKECSFFLDPSLDVRIEIVRERDGSVILDIILKAARKIYGDKTNLLDLAIVIMCLLGNDLRQYVDGKLLDKYFGSDARTEETTQRDIKNKIDNIERNDVGGIYIRNFYGKLYSDPKITSVGASRGHNKVPPVIIKREEFRRRSQMKSAEQPERIRVRLEEIKATLIAPVLVNGQQKWKFRSGKLKFSAAIIDRNFRDKLLAGRTNVQLQAGIEMELVVSVIDHLVEGVWKPKSREVVEVKSIMASPRQEPFRFGD